MAFPRIGSFSLLFLAAACQRLDSGSIDEGPDPSGGSTGSTGAVVDESDDGTPAESEDSDPDSGGPTEFDCDPVAQSGCNGEEKCTVVLQAGEVAYTCVVDDATIDPLGGCQAALGSGIDGCPAGYACIADETEAGLCVPLCLDSGDCDNAVCIPDLVHDIPYCASECSPFEGGCTTPLQCRRLDDQFGCGFARPDDVGGQGEPCTPQQDAGCGEGFVCLPGGLIPGCSSDNCCTVVCDTNADTCDTPASCTPLFDAPAPGSEAIGACIVPS